ncbi:MAG: polyprenyl diphosphate synthase [Gammaproteobacteria bacterium]|jgi:undecaprenyl diphosphate synthase
MSLPHHIAIIMDGNGRWARKRGLPRHVGHRAGVKTVRLVIEEAGRRGVEALTLFAFSSENWRRPEGEVGRLMELFLSTITSELRSLEEKDVRLTFIGDRAEFSEILQQRMADAEARTAGNNGLRLNVAVGYGGRWDITRAARRLAESVACGDMQAEQITPEALGAELSLAGQPEPDLFIRTGGEQRISNFLLWQLAYTELYFCDTYWPDFDARELERALEWYAARQRRFGRTGDQVEGGHA